MVIEINYKKAGCDFKRALADALQLNIDKIEVLVTSAKNLIPFCCDYRVLNKGVADIVAKVDNEYLLLNII